VTKGNGILYIYEREVAMEAQKMSLKTGYKVKIGVK